MKLIKLWHLTSAVVFTSNAIYTYAQNSRHPDYLQALKEGAEAMLTYNIVDAEGVPVEDADVSVNFVHLSRKSNRIEGKSDTNGMFTARSTAQWEIGTQINKNGYYKSSWLVHHLGTR
jgi:hypothetical protein